MNAQMMKALEADGEKLRQLTGEDHGPFDDDALLEAGTHYLDASGNVQPKCEHEWGTTISYQRVCRRCRTPQKL